MEPARVLRLRRNRARMAEVAKRASEQLALVQQLQGNFYHGPRFYQPPRYPPQPYFYPPQPPQGG